jgi:histidine kinase/DNA gyrase B/HSP90-like ATPase
MSPTRQPFSAELHTPGVELAGLLALLGEHLYSTPAVAVLRTDPARRVLIIEDDGAGLTGEEIVADLATIGRGATRGVRDATGTEELIGLFGIGFLSAFVIAHTVTMTTPSWQQPPAGACARGRGRGVDARPCTGTSSLSLGSHVAYELAGVGFAREELDEVLHRLDEAGVRIRAAGGTFPSPTGSRSMASTRPSASRPASSLPLPCPPGRALRCRAGSGPPRALAASGA